MIIDVNRVVCDQELSVPGCGVCFGPAKLLSYFWAASHSSVSPHDRLSVIWADTAHVPTTPYATSAPAGQLEKVPPAAQNMRKKLQERQNSPTISRTVGWTQNRAGAGRYISSGTKAVHFRAVVFSPAQSLVRAVDTAFREKTAAGNMMSWRRFVSSEMSLSPFNDNGSVKSVTIRYKEVETCNQYNYRWRQHSIGTDSLKQMKDRYWSTQ